MRCDLWLIQSFGVAEGRPKEDLKNMANAAGRSCRDYTPAGGETLDQVSQNQSQSKLIMLSKWFGCREQTLWNSKKVQRVQWRHAVIIVAHCIL